MKLQRHPLLALAAVALTFVILAPAFADDKSWTDKPVLPTKRAKEIPFGDDIDGKHVAYTFSGQWPIKVRDERDGMLRIHDGRHEGWVAQSDFVLAKDAPAYFEHRIQTDPKDAWAWYMQGSGFREKGEYGKAIEAYDQSIRLDGTYPPAFNNRAVAWRYKKEYDKSIKDLDEAIRLDPRYALAFANRGAAWKLKDELDHAIKDYDEAIRLDPNFVRYHEFRGEVWLMKKDYDHALRDFDEAIRLDSKYALAYYSKAGCLALTGQADSALDSLQHALKLGYSNFEHMEKDAALDSIRGNERYKSLVKQYNK